MIDGEMLIKDFKNARYIIRIIDHSSNFIIHDKFGNIDVFEEEDNYIFRLTCCLCEEYLFFIENINDYVSSTNVLI